MFARRLSILLSITAMCFLALACSLGWSSAFGLGSPGAPEAYQTAGSPAPVADRSTADRCRHLDDQFLSCSKELDQVWRPAAPSRYPPKVQRLMSIKRRYEMEIEALRACRGEPDAPAAQTELADCAKRPTCDAFANCVADNIDPFE